MPVLLLSILLAANPAPPVEKPKLLVLGLTPAGGLEAETADAFSEAISSELAKSAYFSVVAKKEMETLIGLERQRQMMGCGEDSSACLAELAGALGARFVLSGSLARLGPSYQLSLQVMDTARAQAVGRSSRMANDLAVLRKGLAYAVAEATGTPPPPAPSRILPLSLLGAGGVALVTGGLVGMDALARERSLRDELTLGEENVGTLRPYPEYQRLAGEIGVQKTVTLLAMTAAAGLITAGVLLWPQEAAVGTGISARLVPAGPTGFALVGQFP